MSWFSLKTSQKPFWYTTWIQREYFPQPTEHNLKHYWPTKHFCRQSSLWCHLNGSFFINRETRRLLQGTCIWNQHATSHATTQTRLNITLHQTIHMTLSRLIAFIEFYNHYISHTEDLISYIYVYIYIYIYVYIYMYIYICIYTGHGTDDPLR